MLITRYSLLEVLDLCFGRYDTVVHRVGDCPPHILPGKDYYNPRKSELERGEYTHMPWQDVQCVLWGPPCRDVARHFVQHWNHAKRNKAPYEQTIPVLMPQHHMVLPHYMGNREIDIENKGEINQKDLSRQDSFSSRSPFEDIPLLCIPSRWSRTLRSCLNDGVEEVVFLKIMDGGA